MSKCIGEILAPEEMEQIFAGAERYNETDPDDLMRGFTEALWGHVDELTVKDLYMMALYGKVDACRKELFDLNYTCGRERG